MKNHHTKQHVIVFTLLAFLLGKVFGLHVHGHIAISHDHPEEYVSSALVDVDHKHLPDTSHIVSHIVKDLHNTHDHDSHGSEMFDIEFQGVFSKLKTSVDISSIFLIAVFIFFLSVYQVFVSKFRPFTNNPPFQQRLFLKSRNLRAPPFRV